MTMPPAELAPKQTIRAAVTSNGRITLPIVIRKSLCVEPGDYLLFVPEKCAFRIVRDAK
jgi:bifunctional DNA-binding transcriptional regulator/antitoxin component of YhaV-PrlF toxin-antitoxin module